MVIGGISISGGKGGLLGVLFGAMSYNIIASLGFDVLINDTVRGSILQLAVFGQMAMPPLRSRLKKGSG